ncbi:kmo [Symbiodinium natans]|uniref:Kmo protein n=1 Tax=Symbiodinium natans TaxID=878477 RepID=A0A812Q041_9DINO|nr:kmo [Symbiodinium natans]
MRALWTCLATAAVSIQDAEEGFRGDTACVRQLRDNLRTIASELEPAPEAPCVQTTDFWLPSKLEGGNLTIFEEGEFRVRVLPSATSKKPFSYKLAAGECRRSCRT